MDLVHWELAGTSEGAESLTRWTMINVKLVNVEKLHKKITTHDSQFNIGQNDKKN